MAGDPTPGAVGAFILLAIIDRLGAVEDELARVTDGERCAPLDGTQEAINVLANRVAELERHHRTQDGWESSWG